MKKALSFLFLIGLLTVVVLPVLAAPTVVAPPPIPAQCILTHNLAGWAAVTGIRCPGPGPCLFAAEEHDCAACCLIDSIYKVSFWIFAGIMAIVVIFVLLGAYNIVTAAGLPEKVTAGRNYIIWAIIGSMVALFAWLIPTIVRNFLRLGAGGAAT